MNNYSAIYWLTRVDSFIALLIAILAVSLVVIVLYYLIYFFNSGELWDDGDEEKYIKKWSIYKKVSFIVVIITSLGLVFIPSKNDIILIYAGGKTLNYVKSDTSLSKIPYQTTKIISEYLQNSINELKK